MMKINWKVRLQSYPFWVAIFGFVGLLVGDASLMGMEHYQTYVDAFLVLLIAGGVVSDPTTKGLSDSKQALTYQKPRSDK